MSVPVIKPYDKNTASSTSRNEEGLWSLFKLRNFRRRRPLSCNERKCQGGIKRLDVVKM